MNTPRVSREQADNTITVTGCGDCPMATWHWHELECALVKYMDRAREEVIFPLCPLKTNSLTIQLKQDEQENI